MYINTQKNDTVQQLCKNLRKKQRSQKKVYLEINTNETNDKYYNNILNNDINNDFNNDCYNSFVKIINSSNNNHCLKYLKNQDDILSIIKRNIDTYDWDFNLKTK